MVITRTTTQSKRQHGKSALAGEARRQRMLLQLEIDGTAALRGGEIERKTSNAAKSRGGRYEVAEDGISWMTNGTKRPAENTTPASPPPAKRLRTSRPSIPQCPEAHLQTIVSNKRKRYENTATDDADFLKESIQQLKKVKIPDQKSWQVKLRTMLPYLRKLKPVDSRKIEYRGPVAGQRREKAPDAYELDNAEAKRFFRSREAIDAPVFIFGHGFPLVDPENSLRPIEQVFEWLTDLDEEHLVADENPTELKNVTVGQIKERFSKGQKKQRLPWNFPEITMPTVAESMPDFLRHPSCNLLRDILHYLQDFEPEDICLSDCPNHGKTTDKCPKHFVTVNEMAVTRTVFQHWLGTIMLAEPGAMTHPHFDTFGWATFICCGEGEIGFAWTSNTIARKKGVSAKDRWLFKVLRPGDAVYMDPGRYHLVFRLPEGKQTLGWSPRVLRYCDIVRWLEIISLEVQTAVRMAGEGCEQYILVWRGLMVGTRHVIDQAKKHQDFEKFGGEATVVAAEKLLLKIEKQLQKLL